MEIEEIADMVFTMNRTGAYVLPENKADDLLTYISKGSEFKFHKLNYRLGKHLIV